jgi:hypothetical protein
MIDIDAVRKRARQPTPPLCPPFEGETQAQISDREISNKWQAEWHRDRRDLHEALNEIEILRKSTAPELLALIKRFLDAQRTMTKAEDEMRILTERLP